MFLSCFIGTSVVQEEKIIREQKKMRTIFDSDIVETPLFIDDRREVKTSTQHTAHLLLFLLSLPPSSSIMNNGRFRSSHSLSLLIPFLLQYNPLS